MQTLVDKIPKISYFVFNDDRNITIDDTRTICASTSADKYETTDEMIILSMNNSNTLKYTGVTEPKDWIGVKYKFDGTNWTKNTAYKSLCENCLPDKVVEHDYDATKCSECGETL